MSDLWRLLRLQRRSWRWQAVGVLLSLLVILSNAALLALSGWFIAAMGLAGLGLLRVEYFEPAAAIRALALVRTFGRYLERLVTHDATLRLLSDLKVHFYHQLEPLAPARLQSHRSGDLLGRMRADIDSMDHFYLRVVVPSVTAVLAAMLLVAFLFCFSSAVALADLGGLLVAGVALPALTYRLSSLRGHEATTLRGTLRAEIADEVRGAEELAVFGAADRRREAFNQIHHRLDELQRQNARIEGSAAALTVLIVRMTTLTALVLAVMLAAAGEFPEADIPMLALLVLASFDAVTGLPSAYRSLGETLGAAKRIFNILDMAPAVTDPTAEAAVPRVFDIQFQQVDFRYSPGEPLALSHLSLQIPAGHSLGVIGRSGSGKTTIANILLRFWEFEAGRVLIGGVPIRDLSGDSVRSLCSVVAQQTHLFNTSIRENLRIARPDASDTEIYAALADAMVLQEILQMPDGLDTVVGEMGLKLSGGQARRIAIARAMLRNTPILILDEPTEGLDPFSERAVVDALATLIRGRTTLLISHRSEALRIADSVLDMDTFECSRETAGQQEHRLKPARASAA